MKSGLLTRLAALLLAALLLFTGCGKGKGGDQSSKQAEPSRALTHALQYLRVNTPEPSLGSVGGEWCVIALKRGGWDEPGYYSAYAARLFESLSALNPAGGELRISPAKATDNARVAIALETMGLDPADFNGIDLLTPLADPEYVSKQGINGVIFALIALQRSERKEFAPACRDLLGLLLDAQQDGGWSIEGGSPSVDITAMALQALAPYRNEPPVAGAIDDALDLLSRLQNADGSFTEYGNPNSESCSQTVIALSLLGIDADKDSRFVKQSSLLSALMSFNTESGAFSHLLDEDADAMATEQAALALADYVATTKE